MEGVIAFWIGGFVALFLISALVLLVFGRKKWSYQGVTVSALVAYAAVTVGATYGLADGGLSGFANSLVLCFVPFLAVLAINLYRARRKLDQRVRELAAELERQEDA